MNKKNYKLIALLLEQHKPITATTLAHQMNVSIRTIKTYIHDINLEYPSCISSDHLGYTIHHDIVAQLRKEYDSHIPQTSEERSIYILQKLFSTDNDIDVFDLSEELFISLSTLKIELTKLKKRLGRFDLHLVTKSNKIQVEGLERNKRKLLSSILYDESNVNFLNIDAIQKSFDNIDISFIRSTILEVFDEYHYYVNDYSLINLILHIAISIDRIQKKNIHESNESYASIRMHEYALSTAVVKRLEAQFSISFSKSEIYELTLLLISRATTIDYKSIHMDNIEEFIGRPCLDLVNEMIQTISSYYYIELSEQEFFVQFALHIKNLLVRARNDYFSKNPLTEGIKASCPLIYDAAVTLAGLIKQHTGIMINDDEIAYITFHLGSAIEAQKRLNSKVSAVLFCPNYYDLNSRLTNLLNEYFSQDLLVSNVVTQEHDIHKIEGANLIISTVPLSLFSTPIQVIQPLLTEHDIQAIRSKVQMIQKEKRRRIFHDNLIQLIKPELFEKKHNLHTKEKAIHYMAHKLKQLNYVYNNFEQEVLEREKLSPTVFQSFAIPHAMKLDAKKTGVYVMICDPPVIWDDKQVYLILMLCFNQNERYIFNEVFDPLTMILSDPSHVDQLIQEENYSAFIDTLCSFMA